MFRPNKTIVTSFLCFSLLGCLEVKNDNKALTEALKEQNALLQQQNEISKQQQEQNQFPVSIFGSIGNLSNDTNIENAIITLKVGPTWQDPISLDKNIFSIDKLPANVDLVVLVTSTDDTFMPRAFYTKTSYSTQQNIGKLNVSQGTLKTFSILNSTDNKPVTGLEFTYTLSKGYSNAQSLASIDEHRVLSTYDNETGTYSIVLASNIEYSLIASLDVDGDNKADYQAEINDFQSGSSLYFSADDAHKLNNIYLTQLDSFKDIEIRVTLIDEYGVLFDDIDFFAIDKFKGQTAISFDAKSNQYIFKYKSSEDITLNLASFTDSDNQVFKSATIDLNYIEDDYLSISTSGFSANTHRAPMQFVDGIAVATVTLQLQPQTTDSSQNSVSKVSSIIDTHDNSLKQLYTFPIGLMEGSVSLILQNSLQVIKGNLATNDVVPNGTTSISSADVPIVISTSLSHNNTFLTAQPITPLVRGSYRYTLNHLINKGTGNSFLFNNWNSSQDFSVLQSATIVFDINHLKIDNNNGLTNGQLIVAKNTAGVAAQAPNYNNGSTILYLPSSIESLDFLQLQLIKKVRDGVLSESNAGTILVEDSEISTNKVTLISLAFNENVIKNVGIQLHTNTSLPDGQMYYSYYFSNSSSDHQTANENSATFNYLYRIKGDYTIHQGEITLNVL